MVTIHQPTVPNALVALGPHMTNSCELVKHVGRSENPLVPVQHSAAVQDSNFFSMLPPILLSDDYHVTANRLYGGTEPSKYEDAAYRAGPSSEVGSHQRTYHGGAILELNGKTYPVLIYSTRFDANDQIGFRGGKAALIAHIYEAPLCELEADLVDSSRPVSNLERKWLRDECVDSLRNCRLHMGSVMRGSGLQLMPGFLLNGDYHLVRGALPWLHFREPRTDHEVAVLGDAIAAAMMYDENHVYAEQEPEARPFDLSSIYGPHGADTLLLTVFDRCEQKYAWVPKLVTTKSAEETLSWKPFLEKLQRIRGTQGLVFTTRVGCRTLILGLAMYLLGSYWRPPSDNSSEGASDRSYLNKYPLVELEESSDMEKEARPFTLHTLTAMVRTAGMVSPTRIGMASMAPNSLEKVAAATFAASDAVLAFRDVDGWRTQKRDSAVHCSVTWATNMAARIKEPNAMLIMDLDSVYEIKSIHLVNSAINIQLKCLDEVARLIGYSWVTVVMHRRANDGAAGWFTLDTSLVQRDLLLVTDSVRRTFGAAPSMPPKPAATPESVEQLRKDLKAGLDVLHKAIMEVKSIRMTPQPALAPSPAPLPSVESNTVSVYRMACHELKRLSVKKRKAE